MFVLEILQLRAPIGSLSCVNLIKGLFMVRRELQGCPNTFVNHVKSNFHLNALVFFSLYLFIYKIHQPPFQAIK